MKETRRNVTARPICSPAGLLICLSTCSAGLNPSRASQQQKKQEISRPLNSSPALPSPTSLFFPPPISIPQGGWITASLIERQINKEIDCHLCAPPS